VTSYSYDETGQVLSVTDPKGNPPTTYSYADNYASGDGSPSGNTNTYVKTVTRPVTNGASHITTFSYGFEDGHIRSLTDENLKVTHYCYDTGGCSGSILDPWGRLTEVSYPDGGSTIQSYTDAGPEPYILQQTTLNGNQTKITQTIFDAYGHEIHKNLLSDPFGEDYVDTTYDGMGLVYTVTNPYRTTSDATYGKTTYTYNSLGEKTIQTNSDKSTIQWCYDGIVSSGQTDCTTNKGTETSPLKLSSYSWVDYSDETGKHWQQISDGLGRLAAVLEPDASNSQTIETDYQYDALNNLVHVDQWGGRNGNTGDRWSNFTYDSLSRLTAAHNPESGSHSYNYLTSGNAICAGDATLPCSRTDARGITTQYSYDALNRLTGKFYSDGITPPMVFGYDSESVLMETIQLTTANVIGRPSWTCQLNLAQTTCLAMNAFSYDSMGRTTQLWHDLDTSIVPGFSPIEITATYDLAGNRTSFTNGVSSQGIQLTYGYDNANRLSSVTSSWGDDNNHPATLFSATEVGAYSPVGLHLANLGINNTTQIPDIILTRNYDTRQRLISESDAVQSQTSVTPATKSNGAVNISGAEQSKQVTITVANAATGSVTINGQEQGREEEQPGCTGQPHSSCLFLAQDFGTVSVTIASTTETVNYDETSTSSTIASAIATGFASNSSSLVNATASGATISFLAKAPGSSTDYTVGFTSQTQSEYFTSPSFTVASSGSTLTGGTDATTQTVYDSGTITVTVNGNTTTSSWGQGSSPSTVASAIASSIHTADNSFLSATANGNSVQLNSVQAGSSENWPISVSISYNSGQFASSSYAVTSSGMSGGADETSQTAANFGYDISNYYSNGNIETLSDPVIGIWNYQYDNLNRLTGANSTGGSYQGVGVAWSYDSWGNRTTETLSGSSTTPVPSSSQAQFNTFNQITESNYASSGFLYDAAGNVTNDGLNQYAYDGEGRLCAVHNLTTGSNTAYLYDLEGDRVAKGTSSTFNCNLATNGFTVTNQYVIGLDGEQLSETNGSGHWYHTNVYAGGELLATYGASSVYFAVNNWLGTKRIITDANGQQTTSFRYLPFGNGLFQGGPIDPSEQHYTGKERDGESGNDYFGARYYASSMGRFVSPDWSKTPEGVPYADLSNPQSLNLYAYVRNNPLSKADRDGHQEAIPFPCIGCAPPPGTPSNQLTPEKVNQAFSQVKSIATTLGEVLKDDFKIATIVMSFHPKIKQEKADATGNKCAYCRVDTVPPQKSQAGATPPANEGQTDHYDPKSKGGTDDPSNAEHACRQCNREKSDTDPTGTKWELPNRNNPTPPQAPDPSPTPQ
jgi:RHS repeat-associated protein